MFRILLIFFCCTPLCCSSIGKPLKKSKEPTTPAPVAMPPAVPGTPAQNEQWRQNRFHSDSKLHPQVNPAAIMMSFTFSYIFPTLENNNVAQASVLPENLATTNQITKGNDYKLPHPGTPGFTIDFAIKPNKDWPSWIWGMDFTYFLQKSKPGNVQTPPSVITNSTYQNSFDTFITDVKHISSEMSHKMQMLGMYFDKPIFSQDYAFFCVGFGGKYLNLNSTRNINYTTDIDVTCLCLGQNIKGIGLYFFETIGAFFTDRVGLEISFEHGILYNRYNMTHTSNSSTNAGVLHTANAEAKTNDYNTMQRITAFLAFHDWAFSEKHVEFKIGIDYLTIMADKLSKTLNTSYTDTMALHLPSVVANIAIYF